MHPGLQRIVTALMLLGCWGFAWSFNSGFSYAQDAGTRFNQGVEAFRAGHMQETVEVLEEILKVHPSDARSHELLGLAFSELGSSAEALQQLSEAVRLRSDQPTYWTNLAIFYLRQARTQDAERALEKSLEIQPSPSALRLMGLIRLNQQDYKAAVESFGKALELAHDDVESWYYMGLAQQAQAHLEKALHYYEGALKRDPNDFHTQLEMGTILLTEGRREQALVHLRSAQAIRPGNPNVYQLLSEAYLGSGDLRQALESARHAVELMPKDRQAHYQLGLVFARLGNRAEAQKEFAISKRLPEAAELTPLERWRELAIGAPRTK